MSVDDSVQKVSLIIDYTFFLYIISYVFVVLTQCELYVV